MEVEEKIDMFIKGLEEKYPAARVLPLRSAVWGMQFFQIVFDGKHELKLGIAYEKFEDNLPTRILEQLPQWPIVEQLFLNDPKPYFELPHRA